MKLIKYLIVICFLHQYILNAQTQDTLNTEALKSYFIPANSLNVVLNPGFEELNSKNEPLSWQGDYQIYTIDNKVHFEGDNSLKFKNNNPDIYKVFYQKIKIVPGAKYKFSAYVKTKGIKGKDTGATICLQWYNKDGTWLGGSFPAGIKGDNNWTLIKDEAQISEDAASVLIFCYVRKGMTGEAWFDNVEVKRFYTPNMLSFFIFPKYRGIYKKDFMSPLIIKSSLFDYTNNINDLQLNYVLQNRHSSKIIDIKSFKLSNTYNLFTYNSTGLRS